MNDQPHIDGSPTLTSEFYLPFPNGLVRCAVVVDTRNVHGQARKVFGRGLRPSAEGIRKALRQYGLDAVEIYAGVATKTMSNAPSPQVQAAMADNKRFAQRLAVEDAVVLSGHLAERNGEMEEKQVDVLLALQVADLADRAGQLGAPFDCIVVLSEDMDLMPAYEFAARRGVDVYAAAFDTIHTRPEQKSWLLLDEAALSAICPAPANLTLGAPMRSQIARMATTTAPVHPPVWKVESQRNGTVTLSNSRGLTGTWSKGRSVRPGDRIDLYAVGLHMEPRSQRFPLLTLAEARPSYSPFDNVEQAEVLHWVDPTRVRVRIGVTDTTANLTASPGLLFPGQRIAVLREDVKNRTATYYIGPLGDRSVLPDWPLPETTAVVQVDTSGHTANTWRTKVEGLDLALMVPKRYLSHAVAGTRLRVALAGRAPDGVFIGQPLSCCLPSVRKT